MEDFRYPK